MRPEPHARDSTSAEIPVPDFAKSLTKDVKGMKVGMPKEYFIEGMDPEVEKAVRDAVKALEGLGAKVVEISLPHTAYAVATYYILATSEASSRSSGVRSAVSRRSGRSTAVRSTACRRRQAAIRAWSPLNSTSGTDMPSQTGGRVY